MIDELPFSHGLNTGWLSDEQLEDLYSRELSNASDLDAAEQSDNTASTADNVSESKNAQRKTTQADTLFHIAASGTFFHTPSNDSYVSLTIDGHKETWPLDGGTFRRWLAYEFYLKTGKGASSTALQNTLEALRGKAQFAGHEAEVHTRVARCDEKIYLDLANSSWQAVEIDASGWRIVNNPPVHFRRVQDQRSLPIPEQGGSIDELRSLVTVATQKDWIMLVSFVVMTMNPAGPYPILALHGERGSAKSTTTRLVRSLIDPSATPTRDAPKDARDLVIAAKCNQVLAFDNLSYIPPWLSDAFCRMATGGGYATRSLYTNDEQASFYEVRPIVMNGIEELATRGDLLDRTIVVSLPEMKVRKEASAIQAAFDDAHPRILGALLTAISTAIKNLDQTRIDELPRMADFAKWACAAAPALGWSQAEFLAAYTENQQEAVSIELEASPVVPPIICLLEMRGGHWEGTATDLLQELGRADARATDMKGWPSNPKSLSGILKRLAPALRTEGIRYAKQKTNGTRNISLRKM